MIEENSDIKRRMKELADHWCGVGKNSPEHLASYEEWKKLEAELKRRQSW